MCNQKFQGSRKSRWEILELVVNQIINYIYIIFCWIKEDLQSQWNSVEYRLSVVEWIKWKEEHEKKSDTRNLIEKHFLNTKFHSLLHRRYPSTDSFPVSWCSWTRSFTSAISSSFVSAFFHSLSSHQSHLFHLLALTRGYYAC